MTFDKNEKIEISAQLIASIHQHLSKEPYGAVADIMQRLNFELQMFAAKKANGEAGDEEPVESHE